MQCASTAESPVSQQKPRNFGDRTSADAATAAYVCLGGLPIGPWVAVVFMTTAESCIAFSDVAIDGIVVERSRNEPQATAGKLQSLCWGSQVTPANHFARLHCCMS